MSTVTTTLLVTPITTPDETSQSQTIRTRRIAEVWKAATRTFWSYTDETSKADLSSFRGIL